MPSPVWLLWTAAGVVSSIVAAKLNQHKIDAFFMGVFRDIGRHKAYKRRYQNNSYALMEILLHKEESLLLDIESDPDDVPTYTMAELWEFGSGDDNSPLLISIFGRIYDVSEGERFYGPGSSYQMFPGRDVTYALSTGCKRCALDADKTVDDLTEKQVTEGKRWLSFFQLHDKYPYVGKLEGDHLELLMDELIQQDMDSLTEEQKLMLMQTPLPNIQQELNKETATSASETTAAKVSADSTKGAWIEFE